MAVLSAQLTQRQMGTRQPAFNARKAGMGLRTMESATVSHFEHRVVYCIILHRVSVGKYDNFSFALCLSTMHRFQ